MSENLDKPFPLYGSAIKINFAAGTPEQHQLAQKRASDVFEKAKVHPYLCAAARAKLEGEQDDLTAEEDAWERVWEDANDAAASAFDDPYEARWCVELRDI